MKTIASLSAALLILIPGAGCVPALRAAPDLELQGGSIPVAEAEAAYREAIDLFGTRRPDDVRRSGELLRRSAASLDDPVNALLALVEVLVWQVEHEADADTREDLATRAVHAGQWCLEAAPEQPACRYRLAIAVGVQARERPRTGSDAMEVMLELLQASRAADPALDHGGPDRVLALVYLRAPGWPAGPGDPDLGHEHAVAAAGIDALHPPNHLVLGESLVKLDREKDAIEAYRTALRLADEQRESGGRDALDWLREAENALNRLGAQRLSLRVKQGNKDAGAKVPEGERFREC